MEAEAASETFYTFNQNVTMENARHVYQINNNRQGSRGGMAVKDSAALTLISKMVSYTY
jgi:hypothetical protein